MVRYGSQSVSSDWYSALIFLRSSKQVSDAEFALGLKKSKCFPSKREATCICHTHGPVHCSNLKRLCEDILGSDTHAQCMHSLKKQGSNFSGG